MNSSVKRDVTVVEQAITWLITYHPFYASVLLKRELIGTDKPPAGLPPGMAWTACVNAKGQIWFNPAWMDQLGVRGCAFVLAHECMHYMLGHCIRRGNRDPYWWNHWGDAVINMMLIASNAMYPNRKAAHFEFPTINGERIGVYCEGAEDCNVEELYDRNANPPQQQPQGGQGQPQDGDGQGDGGSEPADPPPGTEGSGKMWGQDLNESTGHDEDGEGGRPLDEGEVAEIEAKIQVEIMQAAESAKRMSKMPGGAVARLVAEIKDVKTPWHNHLAKFMSVARDNDYSYAALDRRFMSMGQYLPWYTGEGLGTVVLVIDVSGSINQSELNEFSGHVNKVLADCEPEKVVVVYVHTKVCKVEEFTMDDLPITLSCNESGGTYMPAGIDYAVDNHPETDCIIVLTDGYTDFGVDPGIPTFWAITSTKRSTWGETVQLEVAA